MSKRLVALVSGRVQGVGYRFFVAEQAHRLGLTGYVRNLPDGEVEVVAEGEEAVLHQLLSALWKGPPAARVTGVQAIWEVASGEFRSFDIR